MLDVIHDRHLKIALVLGRFSLFVVYFWFGALKLIGLSPASPMVQELLKTTMPFMGFSTFIVLFACFEMLIGVLFLIPRLEKIAFSLFVIHMATTIMPLFLMPDMTWQGFLTPTLEGQYIIKNIVLVGVAFFIYVTTETKAPKEIEIGG